MEALLCRGLVGLTCVAILGTATSCRTSPKPTTSMRTASAEALLQLNRPLVIAHRGFSSLAPENTFASFEKALIAGADLTELDYHHTQDGQLVVIHDHTLDRTTDATNRWGGSELNVADYPLEKLRELEAGNWFKQPHAGQPLPELGEALDVIQRGSITLIERKAGDAAKCIALVRTKALLNEVVVQSFDWEYLRDYHAQEPTQILAALGPPGSKDGRKLSDDERRLNADWCDQVQAIGAGVVVWNRAVDRRAVRAAHSRGLKVWVYTINDEQLAHRLLDTGVDGIITDQPTLLWKVLASRSRDH